MQEIMNKSPLYEQKPINAIVTDHLIIPGNNGYSVNLNKSFNKMKKINYFDESLIVYDEIMPSKSINNNHKTIVNGNPYKNHVSLLFNTKEKETLYIIKTILNNNHVIGNYYNELLNEYCFTDSITIQCLDKPTILLKNSINKYHFSYTKDNLSNGNILFYSFNKNDANSLELIINYILNNHYKIVTINEIIKE